MGLAVTARAASSADLSRLADLAQKAATALGGERGGPQVLADELAMARPLDDGLAEASLEAYLRSSSDALRAFVGEVDGVALGFALARVRGNGSTRSVLVEMLYIEQDAREVGLAEAIVGEIFAWADQLGLEAVDAYALPGMRELKNFYESHGFVSRLIVMRKTVGA